MAGNRKILIVILNAAIFIVLEVAALSMLRNNGELQDTWVLKGFHAFYASLWGKTEQVKYYFSLKKENDRLAQENFSMAVRLRHYMDMESEQMACAADSAVASAGRYDSTYTGRYSYTAATIAKISNNRQRNYIILDKGSEDGILPKSGVITAKGVIGIVDAVSRHYSYAISFKNAGMTVSARIGMQGPVGSLVWDGIHTNGAILTEIPHHLPVERGDTVYTSGFSSIFPPDIPLGTVGESEIVDGATYEIKVELFEDFRALRYVTVVRNNGQEETGQLTVRQES